MTRRQFSDDEKNVILKQIKRLEDDFEDQTFFKEAAEFKIAKIIPFDTKFKIKENQNLIRKASEALHQINLTLIDLKDQLKNGVEEIPKEEHDGTK